MKKLIIPDRFAKVDYERDVTPEIKEAVEQFITKRMGLFMYGPAGTGKTHTAFAVCKEMEKRGYGVRAYKVLEVLKKAREAMFNEEDGKENFLDELNKFKGVLFLDDLGTEKGSEWVLEILNSIIDRKYEDMVPVIITSNFNLDEIGRKLDDKIASRIVEMCRIYEMPGNDRRLMGKLNNE